MGMMGGMDRRAISCNDLELEIGNRDSMYEAQVPQEFGSFCFAAIQVKSNGDLNDMYDDGVDGEYDQNWFNERYQPLLGSSAIELFTQGGCHVFASALVQSFSYPLRIILGDGPNAISHVYCVSAQHPGYAIDVLGFSNEANRMWEIGRFERRDISPEELRKYFRTTLGPGLFAPTTFWKPAYEKAMARIAEYRSYYDSSRVERTPDAPLDKKSRT